MKVVKLKGPVVTAVVASLAMAGVVGAFASNASPYVTVAQARHTGGDSLHLSGVLVKGSCGTSLASGHTQFTLKDAGRGDGDGRASRRAAREPFGG